MAEAVAASVGLELQQAVGLLDLSISLLVTLRARGMLDAADLQTAVAYLAGKAPAFEPRFRQLAASPNLPLDDFADSVLGSQADLVPGAPAQDAPPPSPAEQGDGEQGDDEQGDDGCLRPTLAGYQHALQELQLPSASAALAAARLALAALDPEEAALLLERAVVDGENYEVVDD